jgi:hypothetical protein
MKILKGDAYGELILEFDSPEDYETFFDQAEGEGFFSLDTPEVPPDCIFRARALGSPRSRKIRPVSIRKNNNGFLIYLVEPPATSKQETSDPEIKDLLDLIAQQKVEKEKREEGMQIESSEVGKSLFDQIRSLTVTERVNLALKADLMERRILMQENNSKINEFLLRNVRITEQEIAHMARNPGIPLQNLLAITGNKIWMNHEAIRVAVLINPRTPPAIALEMIPTASSGDLLKMHQSPYIREDIRATVRRELKRRGVKIREIPG